MGVQTKNGHVTEEEGLGSTHKEILLCSRTAHLNPWVSMEVPVPDSQDNIDPQGSLSVTFGKSCSVPHRQGIWGPKR